MNILQRQFLEKATAEAVKANHPFAQMAACEAALESNWGNSQLARDANNLFGMKQHKHPNPAFGTMTLPTREFINSHWVEVPGAQWVKYPDWRACFCDRLATLERLSSAEPHYAAALAARDAKTYVTEVSQTWSTDPAWRCRCGQTFLLEQEAKTHEMLHGPTYGHCDRIAGLGRALKVISIYESFAADTTEEKTS